MTNCHWVTSKIEAYFCDTLSDEDLHLFRTHVASCPECRSQIESFKEIDAGVRTLFHSRLRLAQRAAQTNTRPRVLRLAMAGAGLTLAAILLGMGLMVFQVAPGPEALQTPPSVPVPVPEIIKEKQNTPVETLRAKPGAGTPATAAPQPNLDLRSPDGPDFAITDAAGYIATLETYRGRILLFAVVSSEQKAAMKNLQQIYDAFGSRPEIRIVGVSSRRDDELAGATFPKFFNQGSRLMGVREGDYLLIDASGNSRVGGSLSDAASVARVRDQLAQMGIR